MIVNKYDIFLVDLNPTIGSEIQGVRPCLVLQNNAANLHSDTTVICPISSKIKRYPHTLIIPSSKINGLSNESRIDPLQIRTIDKKRMIKKIGILDAKYHKKLLNKIIISFDLNDILM